MDLAFECPTKLLPSIQPLADFDFLLTHLVMKDLDYVDYYTSRTRVCILDNSTNELLKPASIEDILQAAGRVSPDLVIPPDYLGDKKRTEEAFLEMASRIGIESLLPVVQGTCVKEACECAEVYMVHKVTRVAVPFDICCKRTDNLDTMEVNRRDVVQILCDLGFDQIHLLGMNTLSELISYRDNKQVTSLDTGGPILFGSRRLRYGQNELLPKEVPTMNQMDTDIRGDRDDKMQCIYYNIAYLRRLTNGTR